MATASIGGQQGLRLPDLLVLIKQTAECARNRRVLDPRAAIVPDDVLQAKVLYARARAWLLGESPRRAEPQWQRLGDVEAAFFALYDALRSQTRPPTLDEREEPNDGPDRCRAIATAPACMSINFSSIPCHTP